MNHRMPINFIRAERTFPFRIFAKLENENLYVAVEKLSVLYDYFNDKSIDIKDIGKFIQSPNNNLINVHMTVNLTQKGTVITDATISLTNNLIPPETDSEGYAKKIDIILGQVNVDLNDKISISQNVHYNLTKYACGLTLSKIY